MILLFYQVHVDVCVRQTRRQSQLDSYAHNSYIFYISYAKHKESPSEQALEVTFMQKRETKKTNPVNPATTVTIAHRTRITCLLLDCRADVQCMCKY